MAIKKIPKEMFDEKMATDLTGVSPKTFHRCRNKAKDNPETRHLAVEVKVDGIVRKLIDAKYFLSKYPIKVTQDQMDDVLDWYQNKNEQEKISAQNEFLQQKLEIQKKSLAEAIKKHKFFKAENETIYEYYQEKIADEEALQKEIEEMKELLAEQPDENNKFAWGIYAGAIGFGVIIFGFRFLWRRYVKS